MKPAAHIAAVIDVLDEQLDIISCGKNIPADALLHSYFKQRRYIGSKDRGAIAERYYFLLRHLGNLRWWATRLSLPNSARSLTLIYLCLQEQMRLNALKEIYNGEKYAPPTLNEQEQCAIQSLQDEALCHDDMPHHIKLNTTEWLYKKLSTQYEDTCDTLLGALQRPAPLDIRTNTLKTTRDAVLARLKDAHIAAQATTYSNDGIRVHERKSLFSLPAFQQGWFEVQDEGSQLVAQLVQAQKGDKVIDFCAGAGGKTLAMAATMKNKGRILAWDVNERRLQDLPKRLKRAGVDNTQWRSIASEHDSWIKRHKSSANWVLIDVPCSGTGTWRRNPDLKWRFTATQLQELIQIQRNIMTSAARLVAPGGHLVYATCSILHDENDAQVKWFLSHHTDFHQKDISYIPAASHYTLRCLPHTHHTDGFFATILHKKH